MRSRARTGSTVFLQYAFDAKLGIDGSQVTVTKTANTAYLVSVPEFTFIGYDESTFEVAVEDGGVLSWAVPEIDKVEILSAPEQEEYVAENVELLEDQTRVFYDSLITSIDPEITTTYEFNS